MTTITVGSVAGPRTWTRIGERPHVCKDGAITRLAVWTAPCAICGQAFEVATPRNAVSAARSRAFSKVTCEAHRLTPAEASRLSMAEPRPVRGSRRSGKPSWRARRCDRRR